MPLTVVCLNVSLEFYRAFIGYGSIRPLSPEAFCFYVNFGNLVACFLYFQNDFDWPILKKHAKLKVSCLTITILVLFLSLTEAFDDKVLSATLTTVIYSPLFIVMILRRNSVKGQSLYIGLLILIGDTVGYFPWLYTQNIGNDKINMSWYSVCIAFCILLHIAYVVIYIKIAKRDGVSLWKQC